jgi:parvulin-like peptidyl-prolyl isomerase
MLAAAFITLPATFSAAAQNKDDPLFPDPVVAQGNGFEIRQSVLMDFVLNYKTDMAARKTPVPEGELPVVASNILQHLIVNKILAEKATEEEKARVNAEVAKTIEDYRKNKPEDVFRAELKASGTSLETIAARTVEEQLGKAVLVRELAPSNEVSDEAIKKYYEANPDQFIFPEQVRVAQILIGTKDPDTGQPLPDAQIKAKAKLAKEIKAKADAGADFGKLVKQYSDDLSHSTNGGELPPFRRGLMARQFEAIEVAAFSLKTNQVSDPVETMYGYHILKLLEKIPPSKMDFAKISPAIKNHLIEVAVNKSLHDYTVKLEAEYEVKILQPDGALAPSPVLAPDKK